MKTFFSRIEGFLKKVFGSGKWEQTASATITIVAPLLETVVALTAGEPAAALIAAAVRQIQSDLAAAAALIEDSASPAGTSTPATIANVLTSINTNLPALLTAGQIKDPVTSAKVSAIVTTITGELQAILNAIPAAPIAAVPAKA